MNPPLPAEPEDLEDIGEESDEYDEEFFEEEDEEHDDDDEDSEEDDEGEGEGRLTALLLGNGGEEADEEEESEEYGEGQNPSKPLVSETPKGTKRSLEDADANDKQNAAEENGAIKKAKVS